MCLKLSRMIYNNIQIINHIFNHFYKKMSLKIVKVKKIHLLKKVIKKNPYFFQELKNNYYFQKRYLMHSNL